MRSRRAWRRPSRAYTALVTYAARLRLRRPQDPRRGIPGAAGRGAGGSYTNIETLLDEELSWSIDELSPAVISVYYGEDVSAEDAEAVAKLGACFPDAEITTCKRRPAGLLLHDLHRVITKAPRPLGRGASLSKKAKPSSTKEIALRSAPRFARRSPGECFS